MKKFIELAVGVLLQSQVFAANSGNAVTGIEGHYQFMNQECSSGAAPRPLFSGGGLSGSYGLSLTVTSSQVTAKMDLQYQLDPSVGAPEVKQLEEAIATLKQQPESPETQKSMADLQKSLDSVKQMMSGVTCSEVELLNYTLSGTDMTTTMVNQTGNCQGFTSDNKPTQSTVQMEGDFVKFSTAPSSDEKTCPQGDTVISVLKKIN